MRVAYFDCFAGISGEMMLAALLDAGLSPAGLHRAISALGIPSLTPLTERVSRKEIAGTLLRFAASLPPAFDPLVLVSGSSLPPLVKQTTLAVLARLRSAQEAVQARSHSAAPTTSTLITLPEVAAITGVVAGLVLMGIDRVECSPLHVGGGFVQTPSGLRPALSPVAAEVLRRAGTPVYGSTHAGEMVTPVGAAIITTISSGFGPVPAMKVQQLGYGAGVDEIAHAPNVLRVMVGEAVGTPIAIRPAPEALRPVTTATSNAFVAEPEPIAAPVAIEAGEAATEQPPAERSTRPASPHQQSGRQRLLAG